MTIINSGNITNGDLMIICNKTVQGHPSCFDIAVIDDDLVESTEMAAICGCSPQKAVVFDDCFDLILEDNDGEICKFESSVQAI